MFKKNKTKGSGNAARPKTVAATAPTREDLLKSYNDVPQSPEPASAIVFHCQLAHGSPTGFISGFANSPQLYEKIAAYFEFPITEVNSLKVYYVV